jgi:N-methylhydantoinase A
VGLPLEALAEGVVRIAVARMTSSIREISVQQGHDPRDFTLIAFGGAGPMHAIPIAEELGIPRVLVPCHPGNFSALGLLVSDVKHDDVRTRVGPLARSAVALGHAFAEMEAAAAARLETEGFSPAERRIERFLDLRYAGQAFELMVPVPPGPPALDAVAQDFHARHLAVYGHADAAGAVELVNARIAAYGLVEKREPEPAAGRAHTLAEALVDRRAVWFDGRAVDGPVYEREGLPAAAVVPGPAVIEEFGATTVVFPGWRARVERAGDLALERAR